MLLPLVVALLQTPTSAPPGDSRPVRVWLGSTGVLVRGAPVRVYVQAARDGNLIVLHRRTDGRIEVLFPSQPTDDPFVRAGTYEIQATPSRVAFVVAEPDGSGLVLAALTSRTYRFDEFVRAAVWNPEALAPSWDGSDGEGVLSDIVQRMLGDGYFNYDIATYTVAPPLYAMQPDTSAPELPYPTCTDCTFIGYQENVFESISLCDPFFSPCIGDGRFHRRRPPPPSAPAAPVTRTIALAMRAPSSASLIPRDGRSATRQGFVRKATTLRPSPAHDPSIGARTRASPPIRVVPIGPGRPAIAHAPAVPSMRRRVGAAPAAPAAAEAPVQVVRLALSPTRVREEPESAPGSAQSIALTGLTVTPPARTAPRGENIVAPAPVLMPRARGLAGATGSGGSSGAGSGTPAPAPTVERGRTVALPPAVFHGAQARMPVARTGTRHR